MGRGQNLRNIFTTRLIVRINPSSGCIEAVGDLGPLWNAMTPDERANAEVRTMSSTASPMMGATGLFYLTGKRWKTIFSTRLTERR